MKQWTALHGADTVADDRWRRASTDVSMYADATGEPVVWTFLTEGMGHGVQGDEARGCGVAATFAFADVGVCAAWESSPLLGLGADSPAEDTGTVELLDTGTPRTSSASDDPTRDEGEQAPEAAVQAQGHGCAVEGAGAPGPLLGALPLRRRR